MPRPSRQQEIKSSKSATKTSATVIPKMVGSSNLKRKASEDERDDHQIAHGGKRQKALVNSAPRQQLDVFVFGSNSFGELGLGDATKKTTITGPVLNPKLPASDVGVVHLAVGGVHAAAITYDNQILTWGVNDDGALGRDTKEDKVLTEINGQESDSEDSDSDEEVNLNMKEATPIAVGSKYFPKGTTFCQLVATDTATFALTTSGVVYGWGRFKDSSEYIGFSPQVLGKGIQQRPILIPGVQEVTKLAAGAQHVLALTSSGLVYSWGCPEQHQLGRKSLGRGQKPEDYPHLVPGVCGLSQVVDIAAGQYHSFAVRKNGQVFAWGSNNFGQTGVSLGAGESDAMLTFPTEVKSLKKSKVVSIAGGKDHSLAVTAEGECLAWGRIDNKALGLDVDTLPLKDVVVDPYGKKRILKVPTPIPAETFDGQVCFATIGTDSSFVITDTHKAYGWGFNAQCQAGRSNNEYEVERPTLLDNKHLKNKYILSAGAGGQFGILLGIDAAPKTNGFH